MKIVGCLCWYEEHPTWLQAAITSAARFIDHLVAIDGAYQLFPCARPRSGFDQHEAIVAACGSVGIGLTLEIPQQVCGNECEKRSRSFELAESLTDPDEDWFYVIDADEIVISCVADLRAMLAETEYEVAEAKLWESLDPETPGMPPDVKPLSQNSVRKFFRARRGLRVVGAHYVYAYPDGERPRYLWGNPTYHDLEPALDLTQCISIEHRSRFRNLHRARLARTYYAIRDSAGAEQITDIYVEGIDGKPSLVSAGRAN